MVFTGSTLPYPARPRRSLSPWTARLTIGSGPTPVLELENGALVVSEMRGQSGDSYGRIVTLTLVG